MGSIGGLREFSMGRIVSMDDQKRWYHVKMRFECDPRYDYGGEDMNRGFCLNIEEGTE